MERVFMIRMWSLSEDKKVKCINFIHSSDECERPEHAIARAIARANDRELGMVREKGSAWNGKLQRLVPRYTCNIGKHNKQGLWLKDTLIAFVIEEVETIEPKAADPSADHTEQIPMMNNQSKGKSEAMADYKTKQQKLRNRAINILHKKHPGTKKQKVCYGYNEYSVRFLDKDTGEVVAEYRL
ncbi:MAG: hypothetical protein EOM62_13935 [Bacteroidia bacterium]|nr:hypothetical protein [Bacteroidia bacterium]